MARDNRNYRQELLAYIPRDRALAIARQSTLADPGDGAILFVDLSGFTSLTVALTEHLGPRRGAEAATHQLNTIYQTLIATIHGREGSIIGFSGDGLMCWFEARETGSTSVAAWRALRVAGKLQRDMESFATIRIHENVEVRLAVKTVMAAGSVRRFVVGDPAIQVHDVVAGEVVSAMGIGERYAAPGENLVEATCLHLLEPEQLQSLRVRRRINDEQSGLEFAVVTGTWPETETEAILRPDADGLLVDLPTETLQQWILPQIYGRISAGQAQFLAELRPAVALFARFGGIQYDVDRVAGQKLDSYVRWVQRVLTLYGGALIQLTTGDKGSYLYACFGAPTSHDDDPIRAVQAAFALQKPPSDLSFRPQLQIGVAMGRMRVGAYGSSLRKTYGVQGPATNLSAGLMVQAAPGEVVVDQYLAHVIESHFECVFKSHVVLKGNSAPLALYRVARQLAQSARASHLRTSPLVGRDDVLGKLSEWLASFAAGRGTVVRVEGPAGIGKSHLLQNFAQTCREQGHVALLVAAERTLRIQPYGVMRTLARMLLSLAEELTGTDFKRAVSAYQLQPVQRQLLRELLDEASTAAAVSIEPQLRQEVMTGAIVELARQRAKQDRLVLIVDDVHWIDESSQEVLIALARIAMATPLLLVIVHRPITDAGSTLVQQLSAIRGQQMVQLGELSSGAIGALVAAQLGAPITSLGQAVIQRLTHGNPYFVQELVSAMVDSNRLVLDADIWRLSDGLVAVLRGADCLRVYGDDLELRSDASLSAVDLGLPDTIHGVVLARVDRLDDDVALTLKSASVIGREFRGDLLAKVRPATLDRHAIARHIQILIAQEFLVAGSAVAQQTYAFRHSIIQETVYRTLLEVQQQSLHQQIAVVVESEQPEAIEELAYHYRHADLDNADVRAKTLHYLERAAERARQESANETALNYYERALSLETQWPWLAEKVQLVHILGRRDEERHALQQLEAAPGVPQARVVRLRAKYHEALSEYDEAIAALSKAQQICRATGDRRGQLRCLLDRAMIAIRQGEFEQAKEQYETLLAGTSALDDFDLERADASYGLGVAYREQGLHDRARQCLDVALETYHGLVDRRREADTLTVIGTLDWLQRRYKEALTYFDRALNIRREIGDRAAQGSSLITKAQAIRALGDYAEAEKFLHQAISVLQSVGNRWSVVNAWNELGIIYLLIGDLAQAEDALQFALRACDEAGAEALRVHILCNLGQVQRDMGFVANAEQTLTSALQLAIEQEDQLTQAQCLSELAMVNLALDSDAQAEQMAEEAIAILLRLDLKVMTTADLGTLALVALRNGQTTDALARVDEMLLILDECQGEGPDYPQRDYLIASNILAQLGHDGRAQKSLQSAYSILQKLVSRIVNQPLREKFLSQIWFNREILARVEGETWSPISQPTG